MSRRKTVLSGILVTGNGREGNVPSLNVGISLATTWACRKDTPEETTFYVREDDAIRFQVTKQPGKVVTIQRVNGGEA